MKYTKSILLKLTDTEFDKLNYLTEKYEYSKSDLLRRALRLYHLIDQESIKAGEFGFEKDKKFIRIQL